MNDNELTVSETAFIKEVIKRSNLRGLLFSFFLTIALLSLAFAGYFNVPNFFPVVLTIIIIPLEFLALFVFFHSHKRFNSMKGYTLEGPVYFHRGLTIDDKKVSLPAHWQWFFCSRQKIEARAVRIPGKMIFSSFITTSLRNSEYLILSLADEKGIKLNIEDDVKMGLLNLVFIEGFFIMGFMTACIIPIAAFFYLTFNKDQFFLGIYNLIIIAVMFLLLFMSFYKVISGLLYNSKIKKQLNYGKINIRIKI